jgi:hypothetical protein
MKQPRTLSGLLEDESMQIFNSRTGFLLSWMSVLIIVNLNLLKFSVIWMILTKHFSISEICCTYGAMYSPDFDAVTRMPVTWRGRRPRYRLIPQTGHLRGIRS